MATNGHPRSHRLLTAGDFRSVFDRVEVKAACPECLLLARPAADDKARIGFILSKKNIRTAVARNRVKRIAREVFRLKHAQLPALDIVVLGRKGLGQLSREQLHRTFEKQLGRLDRRWRQGQAKPGPQSG